MSARTHAPSDQDWTDPDWLDDPWTAAEPRRRGRKKPVGRRQLAQLTADEDSEQALHEAHLQLSSPIGARILNGRRWFCGCAPFFPLEAADEVPLRTPGCWKVRK